MLQKTITYTDYNGVERSEPFYFNLNKGEILEMEMSMQGGLSEYLTKIVNAKDTPSIFKVFKELILKSYGEKTPNGGFRKYNENGTPLSLDFTSTEAYSTLIMELATDADKAAEFVNGIIPKDMAPSIKAIAANN